MTEAHNPITDYAEVPPNVYGPGLNELSCGWDLPIDGPEEDDEDEEPVAMTREEFEARTARASARWKHEMFGERHAPGRPYSNLSPIGYSVSR